MVMKARLEFATAIRWIARTASLISIGFILMFLIGDRFNPANVRPAPWVGLAFFPVGVVIGMLAAWWKEGAGALIALTSLMAFYAIYGWLLGSNVNSLAFVVFASPALLFLISSLLSQSGAREVAA